MVVDASVVVEALVSNTPVGVRARELITNAPQLVAPHLLDVEVVNGLRRLHAREVISEDLATLSVTQLGRLPIDRFPHQPFLDRVWELRASVSAYDAAYVALAETAGLALATVDSRLANAPGITCDVLVLS